MKDYQQSRRDFLKIAPAGLAGYLIGNTGSQEAQAQDILAPMGLDFVINNPHMPISCRDRAFLNNINRINYAMAFHRMHNQPREVIVRAERNVVQHVHQHYPVVRETIKPRDIPQTFVCAFSKDFDGNGVYEYETDLIGLNEEEYPGQNPVTLGFYFPHERINGEPVKGKNLKIDVFNPSGRKIHTHCGEFTKKNGMRRLTQYPKAFSNHGPGNYAAAFYIFDKRTRTWNHWDTREYKLTGEGPTTSRERINFNREADIPPAPRAYKDNRPPLPPREPVPEMEVGSDFDNGTPPTKPGLIRARIVDPENGIYKIEKPPKPIPDPAFAK